MNYAVIGTGYWGSNHVRVGAEIREEGLVDDLVICDADGDRACEIADAYNVEYTTDYAALPNMGVDAAVVATPSTTHAEIATNLLADGVDLLVEKPLAITSEDAWRIVETAKEHNRTLGVGHIFRYHPALCELKARIDRGELGGIKFLHTTRFSFRAPRSTSGVLYQLGVHDLDIYSFLLDADPRSIYCQLDRFVRDDIDETASLILTYDGSTGVINESWQVPVFGKRRELIVVGSERTAHIDYLKDNVLELYDAMVTPAADGLRASAEGSHSYETDRVEPLRAEVEDFLAACADGGNPRATGEIGARTVELLELARESDERGEAVAVNRRARD